MRILHIQKFFYQHGGGSTLFFKLSRLLKEKGHKIAYFSMHHSQNKKTYWSKYFVSNINYDPNNTDNNLKLFLRSLYSVEARIKIRLMINEFKPDIAHIHDIYHHISPSILLELQARRIPVVQHLSDYHIISPNYNLFHNNQICEISKEKKFYKSIFHKCIKQSYLSTMAEVMEKYFHEYMGWEKKLVDHFIAPSRFMKIKLIEFGMPSKKITILPHFIDYQTYKSKNEIGNYILFFGRLSEEKGLELLVRVMDKLPNIKLKIVGRGERETKLKNLIKQLKINNVELVGFREGESLKKLIYGCRFTILPSLWYEVFGLSILESFASGKPVIASRIGGIPEVIEDGVNGFLCEPGNKDEFRNRILHLWNKKKLCKTLGRNARQWAIKNYNPGSHYEQLINIYQNIINKKINQ